MNQVNNYSIRIIKNENELTQAFALRYHVYKKTYPLCTAGLQQPFEIDEFDQLSIHIGLYKNEGKGDNLIGCSRFILPAAFANQFQHLQVNNHPFLKKDLKMSTTCKLAFSKRLPDALSERLNCFWNELEATNISYCEVGRFIISEEHRSISLSSFFVQGMFAICESLGIVYSFFTCSQHHISFYSRFGLKKFPGLEPYTDAIFGAGYAIVYGTDLSKIINGIPSISALIEQIKCSHEICLSKVA